MTRFRVNGPDEMTEETRRLIELIDAKMGITPNMIKEMAISPAVLRAFYQFRESLSGGCLSNRLQSLIPIVVAEVNSNAYCLSAYTALAKLAGISEAEIHSSRSAENPDRRITSALQFAQSVTLNRGHVGDNEVASLRNARYSEEEIIEIIGHVVLCIFANYFTEVSQTPIGFPRIEPTPLKAKHAG
jgi:uncharacterized peroxidase-related enzyme